MNQQSKITSSITQVSEKTGVSKNRIREWHEKGFLPEVQAISVGSRFHRRFTERDIETIQGISQYQEQGYTLQAAAQMAGNKKKGGKKIPKGNDTDTVETALMD